MIFTWLPCQQEEAGDAVVGLIRGLPEGTRVLVGLHYIGKEELLAKIGVSLQRRIGVGEEKLELLRIVEARDVFTTEADEDVSIVVCPQHCLTDKK